MKRSRLSYDEWKCILLKNQKIKFIENEAFRGYVSQIDILDVSVPQVWEFKDENIIVCQKGYKWISILQNNEYYCITAMLNEASKILLWYIDIIAEQGVDDDGIPYFDDLYLDLVVYPNGSVVEDDRDELEEALRQGDITLEQFRLANDTCSKLKKEVLSNIKAFSDFTYKCRDLVV